jgi:hypothetical protein
MKWAYDERGGFSALPASPLLLPAVLIWGILSMIGIGRPSGPKLPLHTIPERQLAEYRRRYHQLITIQLVRPLTYGEEHELYRVQHPCGDDYPPCTYSE